MTNYNRKFDFITFLYRDSFSPTRSKGVNVKKTFKKVSLFCSEYQQRVLNLVSFGNYGLTEINGDLSGKDLRL